jgi:hypothetical protein
MDISQYRQQYRDEVAKAGEPVSEDLDEAVRVLRDVNASDEPRDEALRAVGLNIDQNPDKIDDLLDILRDTSVPAEQRVEVLYLLRQISFRFALYPAKRAEYLDALRSIVDDPDRTLRRRAVGTLAREKDEYVQRRLIDGLEGREKLLVPAPKAIQLLGYDVHAEFLPVIRRYVEDPPSQAARKEAIRLLAADPTAVDLLLGILRDRSEDADVRRISAIALQSLAPDVLLAEARRIAVDENEPAELRAWALTTLTHFDDQGAAGSDMAGRVQELGEQSSSRQVKQATRAFVSKYAE